MSGLTVRPADAAMLPALRHIWEVCFPDDEAFAALFFARRWSPEHTLVAVLPDGTPVGTLYCLPATLNGRPLWYGYGIGVLPAYRGQGVCERMHAVLNERRQRAGADYLLHPANDRLAAFYARIGLSPVAWLKRLVYRAGSTELTPAAAAAWKSLPLTAEEYRVRRQQRFGGQGLVDWDEAALQFAMDAHRLYRGNGRIAATDADGGYTAALLGTVEDGQGTITETTADDAHLPALLEAFCRCHGLEQTTVWLPESHPEGETVAVGMGFPPADGVRPYLNLMLD